jgi:hypothetical protein
MEPRYLLTESELIELLQDRVVLAALENADIYEWPNYQNAFEDEDLSNEWSHERAGELLDNYEIFN